LTNYPDKFVADQALKILVLLNSKFPVVLRIDFEAGFASEMTEMIV